MPFRVKESALFQSDLLLQNLRLGPVLDAILRDRTEADQGGNSSTNGGGGGGNGGSGGGGSGGGGGGDGGGSADGQWKLLGMLAISMYTH